MYTSSPAQAQHFASHQPTPSLASSPINPINPNGPIGSFSPGKLSLDGHAQHVYNGFIYDIPLPGETGQLYLVTIGHRVGIIAGWPTWSTFTSCISAHHNIRSATSPYVVGISHATFCKVDSFGAGLMAMLCAIDKKVARWVP